MVKVILKYLGYFALVAGCVGTIYGIGVFFTNMQNKIDQTMNTVSGIKIEQTDQGKKITSIEFEVKEINTVQAKQESFDMSIDQSYKEHLKKSKDQLNRSKELIDEYTKYLEMQIENEKKKKSYDFMDTIKHSFKIEKINN